MTGACGWAGRVGALAALGVLAAGGLWPARASADVAPGSAQVLDQTGAPVGDALTGPDAIEDAVRRIRDGALARTDDSAPWSIVVGAGVYGDVSIDEPNLDVRPSPGAAVVLSGAGVTNDTNGGCINVFRGGVVIEGLDCQAPAARGIQVSVLPGGGGVTLRGVSVERPHTSGVAVVLADAVSIEGSTVSDAGTDGIRFSALAGPGPYLVTDSAVRRSGDDGIDLAGAASRVGLQNVVAEGNHDNGIEADAGPSSLSVSGASLVGNSGDGARLSGGAGVSVVDSRFSGNAGVGLDLLAGSGFLARGDRFDGTDRLGDVRFSGDVRTGGTYESLALGGATVSLPGEPRGVVLSSIASGPPAAGSPIPIGLAPVGGFVRLKATAAASPSQATLRFLVDPVGLAGFQPSTVRVYRDAGAGPRGAWLSLPGGAPDPAGSVEATLPDGRIGGTSATRFATYGPLGVPNGTPAILGLSPAPGVTVTGRRVILGARVVTEGGSVVSSAAVWLDRRRRGGVGVHGRLLTLSLPRLTLGHHVARLLVVGPTGLRAMREWSFQVRNAPPVVLRRGARPRPRAVVHTRGAVRLSIPARDDDPVRAGRVRLLVDGHRLAVRIAGGRVHATERLAPGTHHLRIVVRDRNGAAASRTWTFRVATP